MTNDIDQKARQIAEKHGLRCLIPVGKSGFTCHEHTLCDCKVIEFLSAALQSARNEALEEAAIRAESEEEEADDPSEAETVAAYNRACNDIATAIRALKGE